MQSSPSPHLHVDLFKAWDEVSDLAKSKTTHPGRSSYAHQENPFLVVAFELLVHKVYLEQGKTGIQAHVTVTLTPLYAVLL